MKSWGPQHTVTLVLACLLATVMLSCSEAASAVGIDAVSGGGK